MQLIKTLLYLECFQCKRVKLLDILSRFTKFEQILLTNRNQNFLNWNKRKSVIHSDLPLIIKIKLKKKIKKLFWPVLFSCLHLQLFSFTSRWHQQLKEKKHADTSVMERVLSLLKREKPWEFEDDLMFDF